MGYLQDKNVVVSLFLLVFGAVPVTAEKLITVSNTSCGDVINMDTVQTLHLNYYGAKLENPKKGAENSCLYNISSSRENELEICIQLMLKKHQDPWDISCSESIKIYIGKFRSVHMPSWYHCSDLKPLCTSEKSVYVLFVYDRVLPIMGKSVSIELDIYLRNKMVITTTRRPTTVLPSLNGDGEDSATLSTFWIVVIVVGAVSLLCFCCCVCYFCFQDDENAESQNVNNQPESQNMNNQLDDDNPENIRMLQTPVVHPPPENTLGAAGDPPDYYSVCPYGTPDKAYATNKLPYPHSGFEDGKVVPSAPPPSYLDYQ